MPYYIIYIDASYLELAYTMSPSKAVQCRTIYERICIIYCRYSFKRVCCCICKRRWTQAFSSVSFLLVGVLDRSFNKFKAITAMHSRQTEWINKVQNLQERKTVKPAFQVGKLVVDQPKFVSCRAV